MRNRHTPEETDRLTPAEAASALSVTIRTLHRWEALGFISSWRTPGGHRRYDRAEVEALRERSA